MLQVEKSNEKSKLSIENQNKEWKNEKEGCEKCKIKFKIRVVALN